MAKKSGHGLESIPGIGKSLAKDLRNIGIDRPSCLIEVVVLEGSYLSAVGKGARTPR